MPGKASSSKTRSPPATRFVVCRTAQGCWIASAKDGRVTGAFPVPPEIARYALRYRQSGHARRSMRHVYSSPARRS